MRNYLKGIGRAKPVEDNALLARVNAISARSRLEARDYPEVQVTPAIDVQQRFWTPDEVATRRNDCEAPE